MIFWYLTTCDKDSDEPAQVCILSTALMAQACQAPPLLCFEWINFVSIPFVYKFELANLLNKFTQLFNAVVCMAFLK